MFDLTVSPCFSNFFTFPSSRELRTDTCMRPSGTGETMMWVLPSNAGVDSDEL